jgi:hypothetical protein
VANLNEIKRRLKLNNSVSYHYGMAHSQAEDKGNGLKIWKVAMNILNSQ